MKNRCPHCTAPVDPEVGSELLQCPHCSASLHSEAREDDYYVLHAVTSRESHEGIFSLAHLRPVALRTISLDELREVDITPCPGCSHRLRLSHLARVERKDRGFMIRFPQPEERSVVCSYCGASLPWKSVSTKTLDVEIEPPAANTKDYELEQFLKDKPPWSESAPRGCLGSTILLTLLLLLVWIL